MRNRTILQATILAVSVILVSAAEPTSTVTQTPGLVAFWDFVKREPDGAKRFTAHVPAGAKTDYPLDAANYIREYWDAGRLAKGSATSESDSCPASAPDAEPVRPELIAVR
jgi:hypothetical protein